MRFPEGLFIDVERTLGELKFAALRRESFAQDEEGNVTDEVIKRTYDLKCQRQGRTITVSTSRKKNLSLRFRPGFAKA